MSISIAIPFYKTNSLRIFIILPDNSLSTFYISFFVPKVLYFGIEIFNNMRKTIFMFWYSLWNWILSSRGLHARFYEKREVCLVIHSYIRFIRLGDFFFQYNLASKIIIIFIVSIRSRVVMNCYYLLNCILHNNNQYKYEKCII